MSLTVIIPSRNPENLRECAVRLEMLEPEAKLVIVWDRSRGNGECKLRFSRETLIETTEDFCFAKAINTGALWAEEGSDIVLLNDDALLETPLGFQCLRRFAREYPQFGLLSPLVKGLANPVHAWREPVYGQAMVKQALRAIPFVCVYLPRHVFDCVGPLDERFTGEIGGEKVYGGEDDDYCYRIRQAGYQLGVFNGCVVDHGTLPSTFRGLNGSLPINATRQRFREIHGFEMGAR